MAEIRVLVDCHNCGEKLGCVICGADAVMPPPADVEAAVEARIVAWLRLRGRVSARIGGSSQELSLAADAVERGEHRG